MKFDVSQDKNIVLVVAPNGGGKTEIAFSFWWVLYGFNFKSLRGKTMTAYALNSDLYKELLNSEEGAQKTCSVQLKITADDGCIYSIKRTGIFTKKPIIVTNEEQVEMYHINPDGTKSLLEKDPDVVLGQLSRIIPEKILAGLIFDGERMQQLNDEDKQSAEAIEGVIKHVTNEALFELCRKEFKEILKDNTKDLKKVERILSNSKTSTVESEIEYSKLALFEAKESLSKAKEKKNNAEAEIEKAKGELIEQNESQKFELLRQRLEDELNNEQQKVSEKVEDFYKDLDKGYLLITDKLIEDTRHSLDSIDVPSGLTTQAVRSIMSRHKCICGHDITEKEISVFNELLKTLPPDNISSTISEMTKMIDVLKGNAVEKISGSFTALSESEDKINNLKKEIANISSQLSNKAPEKIKYLEKKRDKAISVRNKATDDIEKFNKQINDCNTNLDKLEVIRKNKSEKSREYKIYNRKERFIEKCQKTIEAIDEYNKILSLETINERINQAYKELSSDYALGRRLHIITYDDKLRYSMHTYSVQSIEELHISKSKEIQAWRQEGLTDKEIREKLIIYDSISGSTGQSKVNSLAFAKAILDYSSEKRDENNIVEISRAYPFLIDSPFTELDNDNQTNTANYLRTYSKQIILLASEKSMTGIEHFIKPYVSRRYEIEKITSEHTEIKVK